MFRDVRNVIHQDEIKEVLFIIARKETVPFSFSLFMLEITLVDCTTLSYSILVVITLLVTKYNLQQAY